MKYVLIAILLLLAGCQNTVETENGSFNIKKDCIKTNLWVTKAGHATARPVYDCSKPMKGNK